MRGSQVGVTGGRALAYTDIGEPDWPCVFFFHGAPGSRMFLAYLEDQFLVGRVRVVSLDRPSYGGSSPRPGRSMADWPLDVAALADSLGVDRFLVAGHSSGGPYAVACLSLLPERVLAGIVIDGVTDMGWPGAWDGYMSKSELELMRLPDEEATVARCIELYGADGSGFMEASDFELAQADTALFEDRKAGPALASALAEGFRQGVAGYAQDIFVQGRPWPFDTGAIGVPVHVLHGELDPLPLAHSRHTSKLIPGSTLRVLPGHGHVTTASELPAVASELVRSLN